MGYLIEQWTEPQTLGIGLQDSPAGLHRGSPRSSQAWSDSGGDLFHHVTPDQVLTWVTLYWVTRCITSSVRIYWESRAAGEEGRPHGASRYRPA